METIETNLYRTNEKWKNRKKKIRKNIEISKRLAVPRKITNSTENEKKNMKCQNVKSKWNKKEKKLVFVCLQYAAIFCFVFAFLNEY